MRYQRVVWLPESPDYPVVLYGEMDDDGWEVRKVERYADGRLEAASETVRTGDTELGYVPVPPLNEINTEPEFDGIEITAEHLDAVWSTALVEHTRRSRPRSGAPSATSQLADPVSPR